MTGPDIRSEPKAATAVPTSDRRTPPHILTLVAMAGIGSLAMNIFLPSLPDMAREFGVDYAVMQLSVSAYLLASGVLQLFIGPLSDSYGRRPVMLGAFMIFLAATVGTILAPTANWFLAFRIMQAVSSAGFVLSRAVVRDITPADRAAARIGYVTMGMAMVPMVGPIIGGVLHEAFGWRSNFMFLGALGLAVLCMAWVDMGETIHDKGLGLRAQIRRYPVLLSSVRFWGYCGAAATASGCYFAYLGGASFVGETVFHLTPAEVGYFFAIPALGYVVGNFSAGRWSSRYGMNMMILVGAIITFLAVAGALMADLLGVVSPLLFFGAIGFIGMGNGMLLPNALAGMMSVRPDLAGTASGIGGAMNIGGGAILAAITGMLLVPGAGARPLLWVMFISAIGSCLAILWVIRRDRRLGAQ
ncbi:multidrug effflux MFS transporter [Paracoccus pacificus]|uniref:Bcr/CflA family efflux transporter n=1 Tax=Paracoccus pacificus TaxID=1463598 RepID=A0ABW4RB28_9RHOB